ncbi:MAG: hypothetical protein PCFJNLEI_02386 [Verrucomicrobiae bacterium]|nr:hypothetical protein [Verrucomicrobiae bacterium]
MKTTQHTKETPHHMNALKTAFFAVFAMTLIFAHSATATPDQHQSRHYVVLISSDLPAKLGEKVFGQSLQLLLKQARPGDRVEFLAAPKGTRLADVVVPEGTVRERANSREYAGQFGALKQFVTTSSAPDSSQAMQLRLPQLLDDIGRSFHPQEILTLIVVGSPLYIASNEREAAFDMEKGLTPSDGMIAASIKDSLFGTKERKGQLQGATVHWLTPSDDWALSEVHRRTVIRFWAVFVGVQGATLSTLCSDTARVFGNAVQGESTPIIDAILDPNDRELVMRPPPVFRRITALPVESHVEVRPVETPTRLVTPPAATPVSEVHPTTNRMVESQIPIEPAETPSRPETPAVIPEIAVPLLPTAPKVESPAIIKAVTEIPQTPQGRIGIAAVWEVPTGAASAADMDLYVAAQRGGEEVYWRHPEAPGAFYFRDVRHAGPAQNGGDWTASWEYVEVKHGRLEDVSIWLNVYSARSSVSGIVRIQFNGRTVDKAFHFAVTRGNRGGDSNLSKRRESPYWQEIKLADLFTEANAHTPIH